MEQNGKIFKFFFSDVQIWIIYEIEIYCSTNGFLKWNIIKNTSYIVGNNEFARFAFLI